MADQFPELAGFPGAEVQRVLAEANLFKRHESLWLGQVAGVANFARALELTAVSAQSAAGVQFGEIAAKAMGTGWNDKVSSALIGVNSIVAASDIVHSSVSTSAAHAALTGLLHGVKISDMLLPSLASPLLPVTSELSKIVLSDSAFTQWRAATGLHATIEALARSSTLSAASQYQFENLTRLTGVTETLARLSTDALGSRATLAARPMVELESYAGRLRARSASHTSLLWPAGNGVAGLSAHDAFVAVDDPEDAEDLAATVERDFVAPWEAEANASRLYLYERLNAFDPHIAELLQGAWDSVARPGPADVVKVGTCAVEAVIRALRSAAPDDEVVRWLGETGRRVEDFVLDGKVTRRARVRYLLRGRKGDVKLVEAQADALSVAVEANHSRLQAAKHASSGDLSQVRAHLVTAESLLTQLFAFD